MVTTLTHTGFAAWLIIVGLGFFFGLAYEDFNARAGSRRPGGVRSFPLLALAGGVLYALDPAPPLLLGTGLAVLGLWLGLYYWRGMEELAPDGSRNVGLMAPLSNLVAFLIGPLALAGPFWMAVGLTVAATLLLTARETLHGLARGIDLAEIVNAGRFLLITGLVLPLLPDRPVTTITRVTPHEAWLAMVAVSSISYASYLLRRYVVPRGSGLLVAFLGGIYSSTVTTVVLARRAGAEAGAVVEAQSGIVVANAVMYPRLLAVILLFNPDMALALAPWMLAVGAFGGLIALGWYRLRDRKTAVPPIANVSNPLGLGTAATFGVLFVIVSILASVTMRIYGSSGLYTLAGIVGVTDINPFIISLATHGAGAAPDPVEMAAVLIATGSNHIFHAIYASVYSRGATGAPLVVFMALMAAASLGAAILVH
ncbi:MAG TPA: DUF4010 domain-containing protein [Acidiphilium sp.]|jgi:uncharacterized membrane protein (DUF4010 family)|uniref:MgtC/SapB family protein n=1 Tax=unclassified Acidiphilium TaxID=2617493 RepID=UPI000BC96FA3|nr:MULTISPECIES: DUF4010 domain-containing protein [unclassified Acidiphilium]OYV56068.1 MAG: hypothetical protein B7Z76_07620 [Acidiphilium sp. 20-67-58]HQT61207.1 DUF4010 domain-containing protein [Acidiphilium sp.]HQU11536.1 DUF4010 domain-containing protein [Acidiphilium sp.]